MSGHSHFKTVKATKDANDAKRGKVFSKLARIITLAVKEKGKDITTNATLKTAIEKAKEFNMPKENIERAIKKGTGELAGENLEEFSFDSLGPGGIAIIIEGITDNKNRTLGEIKSILSQYGGKMAEQGAVKWMFKKMGFVTVDCEGKPKEELELLIIEAGVQDIKQQDNLLEVYTEPENMEGVRKFLENRNIKIDSVSLVWLPNQDIETSEKDKATAQKLFEELNENDAIQDIYSNLKI